MKHRFAPVMFVLLVGFGLIAAGAGANELLPWIWMALILPVSAWYLEDGRRATGAWFPAVVLIAVIAAASVIPVATIATGVTVSGNMLSSGQVDVKKFSSYEELENFVRANAENYSNYRYYLGTSIPTSAVTGSVSVAAMDRMGFSEGSDFSFTTDGDFGVTIGDTTTNTSTDFSTTNIQIEGVDEADIVKSDGEYIYVVSGKKVIVIDAYPAEDASILSEIEENTNPIEIFISGDKLVVLGRTFAKVYDISDRENPVVKRDVSFDGYYFKSRMIGNFVYLIIDSRTIYCRDNLIPLPRICSNGDNRVIQATEIYYFEHLHSYSYRFMTIMAIDTQNDDEEITSETSLMSTAQNIFVSSRNIYITYTNNRYWYNVRSNGNGNQETEKTIIHKIAISNGEIEYKSQGEVPGRVLNQFSMDEYRGYFRVATTTGSVWSSGSNAAKNHVYVLDGNLSIVGRLENIAPTERIYSARFMGDRAYLVTFRRTDPLFVLDLSNARDPKVLGELEIPGYSDYLHPYDENHIIGVGRDGGVKIALFDVSDPENPVEISKYEIGSNWRTSSYALTDHRAFLFSRSRNLLVMPIGSYSRQDAYVFSISPENGIALRGTVTHQENSDNTWSSYYSYYRYYSNRSVKRSLYIDNVLYTISGGLVKMNSLEDLSKVNTIELSTSAQWPPINCYPMIG